MNYLKDLRRSSGKLQAFLCLRQELLEFPDNPTLQRMLLQLAEYIVEDESFYVSLHVAEISFLAKDRKALLDFVRRHQEVFQRHTTQLQVVEDCLRDL